MGKPRTCDAIASICAATVFVGLNGESIPPSVVTGSFFVLVTLVNTMRNTRARHVPFSIMGSITSVCDCKRKVSVLYGQTVCQDLGNTIRTCVHTPS